MVLLEQSMKVTSDPNDTSFTILLRDKPAPYQADRGCQRRVEKTVPKKDPILIFTSTDAKYITKILKNNAICNHLNFPDCTTA